MMPAKNPKNVAEIRQRRVRKQIVATLLGWNIFLIQDIRTAS